MKIHIYYVYMLTNFTNSVLYIGVTNNLIRRVYEHKTEQNEGFTKKYKVKKLVYYEIFNDINLAITREKQLKGITRDKKIKLINNFNPKWEELYIDGKIISS